MRLNLIQRRRRMIGECQQAKNDAASHNENRDPQIPMEFDANFEANMHDANAPTTHPDFEILKGGAEEEEL